MKEIKKFKDAVKNLNISDNKEKKSKKEQDNEIIFKADSLKRDEEKPGFKSSLEEQDKVEKEFKKNKDKIQKFESFITVNINVDDQLEDDESEFDSEYEESETSGCGCCDNCTGEEECYCGCENCKCGSDENIKKASEFVNTLFSESLKYHLENEKPITENIFRPGSEAFFNVIKEARQLFDLGKVQLCDIDKELYESTEIGNFGYFNGELVPLDLPMESIEELNEAEYKGKEVKLNYPTRSSGPKKYKVYVKNPKTGKVIKVNFGDVKGGLTAKISDPKARKAFSSRMNCPSKKDKTKAGFWACRLNKFGHLFGGRTYPGYW